MGWFVASHLVSALTGGGLLSRIGGNLVKDCRALFTFLRTHSIWLTVSIALAGGWGIDHVMCHRHAAKVEKQLAGAISARDALKHQLDGITTAKDTQRVITRTNLQTVTRIIHDADTTAHAIERAPTEPGCKTPKEILDANI